MNTVRGGTVFTSEYCPGGTVFTEGDSIHYEYCRGGGGGGVGGGTTLEGDKIHYDTGSTHPQLIFLQLSLTWLGLLYLRKVAVKTRKTGKLYWPNWVLIGGKEEEGGV